MKILVTGAHFTPAQAVIEEFQKKEGIEVVYVGRSTTREGDNAPSVESKILPSLGIKFIPITTGRLQMALTPYTILSLIRVPVGFMQALVIILSEKPDVILSFGGYVGVPIVLVGWLFSIPIIIHEQTLVSGLANRIASFFADKIALSFKNGKADERTIITGNPIRGVILNGVKRVHLPARPAGPGGVLNRHRPTVLITGGNQGSHTINKTVEQCLTDLIKITNVIHVAGDNKFGDFERLKKLGGPEGKYKVFKWIDKEYGTILRNVDLVVSRAGANTLTELAYLGKPALVIPIPYLFADEQNKNAKFFASFGLVKILPQSKLSSETLMNYIKVCLNNLNHFKKSADHAKSIIIPDAAKRLALETLLLVTSPISKV